MTARIFIYVQHLLGTGHLRRVAAIGAALAGAGFEVDIASGGPPIRGLDIGRARLVQLPPLRAADSSFKRLLDAQDRPIDDAWRAARSALLRECFVAVRPAVLITELFPFGRRALEFELLPLLEAAHAQRPRPLVLCSLRDVLVKPADPAKVARAMDRARTWYDRLLVHGDPNLIELAASYPAAQTLADRIIYTGYIASEPGPAAPPGEGAGEILVSAGGGAVGARLFEAALAARAAGAAADRPWRLLLGADLPAEARASLLSKAGPGITIEPARRDFRSLLQRCHVSVSQAGYNTVMDVMSTGARAVLVPFAGGGETEQAQRAEAMAARGWIDVVPEDRLEPQELAAAIDRASRRPPPRRDLSGDGAAETVRQIRRLLGGPDST